MRISDWSSDVCSSDLPIGVVPGLGEDARRLEQHAQMTQGWVDADRKCGLDPEVFGAVAVELLDAAFGVAAVRAHVPLARCAVAAGHRIWPADDPDRPVPDGEAGAGRRLLDLPDRLMSEDQPAPAWWRPAIVAGNDLSVGPADPDRQGDRKSVV